MHFGETLSEEQFIDCIETAYESGVRTFVTSDVYGNGKADELLGKALGGIERSSYALVGMVGHDFYHGQRQGSRGYPRFTDPELRKEDGYLDFIRMATSRSLERCGASEFDLLMLHNPDEIGYTSEPLWSAFSQIKAEGLTRQLGIAPGPANGFTLDLIYMLENFPEMLDWAMLILNPLEPWPVGLCLPACEKHGVKVMTRVVDHGGIFHDDIGGPEHTFKPGDHRSYRPEGWVQHGMAKANQMRPLANDYGLTMLQFACIWNLSHPAVECVVPTFIQEAGQQARPIADKIREFGNLPNVRFTAEEVAAIRNLGDNTGCMTLKGASKRHASSERPDEWPMREDLLEVAARHDLGDGW